MAKIEDLMGIEPGSDDELDNKSSDDDLDSKTQQFKHNHQESEDELDEAEEKPDHEDSDEENSANLKIVKPLNVEESEERLRRIKKSGVVYLSTIPPYMKPIKVKQILSRFGEVGRIYLTPEDSVTYSRRVKSGGNRKKMYVEGWAEFASKKKAKVAAEMLNGNPLGGKKGSFYYDDIMNIKYLPKFKWHDLTEQIALEVQERQEKLKAEIAQATKENRVFIDNVERKEHIERLKRKADAVDNDDNDSNKKISPPKPEIRRTFNQKPAEVAKKDQSKALNDVLSKVF